ncbi:hypothetical protein GQ43DRAFT_402232 [Delitschia confertaspora ATCC 74209]|uniref:Methyltransferase domain-containing protein n=1 Tax=Delitschia confertaspora ATCC 74209 TaxID=1513339 RepID=A0A9P4MPD6_9PLEO|nr:hypothetical protein GQ43DRAFT_402232 [Delitschia confertaspora ATCC 74209]
MADAKTLEEIAEPEYWDSRYSKKTQDAETFEWFKSFEHIESFLKKWIPKPDAEKERKDEDGEVVGVEGPRILHLGCGNSSLPLDLYNRDYHNQICVDFSSVVISSMSSRYSSLSSINWQVADVRTLTTSPTNPILPGSIDVAIDKGTLDAMLYGSLWDPPEAVLESTKAYIDEVVRVLKKGGVFVYITYRQPHFMRKFLERQGVWDVVVEELGNEAGAFGYFGFGMRKM